jgi:hypothetical protein
MKNACTGYLSVRAIPPELEERIAREARVRGQTKSRVVVDALRRAFRPAGGRRRDLKRFFGGMSREEGRVLLRAVHDRRRPDPDLWR